jgi:heme oxygenase (biliverdin-IX-beta and delta-forming)
MSVGAEARRFLRHRRHGVLSTLSRKFEGYPFGSIVPFALDHAARPVMLISALAEHTRNLQADSRVSLLAQDAGQDVQAGARLTLIGDARPGMQMALARYLNYVPGADKLLALGDFSFWTITPRALRFIGGFGDIRWISAESYAPPAHALAEQEDGIISHMNLEHAQALRDFCRCYHRRNAEAPVMIGIDCDGFDIRVDDERPPNPDGQVIGDATSAAGRPPRSHPQPEVGAPAPRSGVLLRFDFERPVTDAASAREALVAMARKARAA